MHAPEHSLVYLNGNSTEVCISLLNKELKINWLYAPFSRCLACNELLVKPSLEDTLAQVPQDIRETSDDFSYCPDAKRSTGMAATLKKCWSNCRIGKNSNETKHEQSGKI